MPRRSTRREKARLNLMASKAFSLASPGSRRGYDVTPIETLRRYLNQCPLIGIIRGVTPDEAEAIGEAIYEAGIRIIEAPLNSPDPLVSIERLAGKLGDPALVRGGTVLRSSDVHDIKAAGGRLIVSPNANADVITATVAAARLLLPPPFFAPPADSPPPACR